MPTLILDYSTVRPSPASIKAAGYVGVMRYLAPLPNPKVITKAEADALLATKLGVGLVWESTGNRAVSGIAGGSVDASRAELQADSIGMPGSFPIFYAVDFDTTGPTVVPYFQGVNQAHRRDVGIYGPHPCVDYIMSVGLATYGWQAGGWVHGADSNLAHLKQLVGAALIPNTDANVLLKPFPMWGLTTGDDDMPYTSEQIKAMVKDALEESGVIENAGETRRQGGVMLGALKPGTDTPTDKGEQSIAAQVGQPVVDVAALAGALAANPTFVKALADAVKNSAAQEYAGTFKPVQP